MANPFIGEIKMFAGNFAPRGWALCDGQLLTISQNSALFSLFGSIYGGDGRTTFGLPDLRGRIPVHAGTGPGLTTRPLGQKSGVEEATLTTAELPSHNHNAQVSTAVGTDYIPTDEYLGASPNVRVFRPQPPTVAMNTDSITAVGENQGHANVMPFLCINFIVALVGTFPSRP